MSPARCRPPSRPALVPAHRCTRASVIHHTRNCSGHQRRCSLRWPQQPPRQVHHPTCHPPQWWVLGGSCGWTRRHGSTQQAGMRAGPSLWVPGHWMAKVQPCTLLVMRWKSDSLVSSVRADKVSFLTTYSSWLSFSHTSTRPNCPSVPCNLCPRSAAGNRTRLASTVTVPLTALRW